MPVTVVAAPHKQMNEWMKGNATCGFSSVDYRFLDIKALANGEHVH